MPVILALVACALFGALALLQLSLIAGAPLGRFVWGGQEKVLPAHLRVQSVGAVVVYAIFATVLLQAVGIVHVLDDVIAQVAAYAVAACCFAAFVISASSRSPQERATMTPMSLVLAALCLFVAVTGHLAH